MSDAVEQLLVVARGLPWPGAWTFCQLAAALVAVVWLRLHCRERPELIRDFGAALAAGAVGALALGFVYRLPGVVAGTRDPFGVAAWGALIGSAAAFALLAGRRGISAARALDLVTPALFVLLAVGRVGCFVAGCDSGVITDCPWALRFPAGTEVFRDHLARGLVAPHDPRSLTVHPAQLYEASAALALAFVGKSLSTRSLAPGVGSALCAATYAVLRIGVDQFRPRGPDSTAAELTSIAVLAMAAAWLLAQRRAEADAKFRRAGLCAK